MKPDYFQVRGLINFVLVFASDIFYPQTIEAFSLINRHLYVNSENKHQILWLFLMALLWWNQLFHSQHMYKRAIKLIIANLGETILLIQMVLHFGFKQVISINQPSPTSPFPLQLNQFRSKARCSPIPHVCLISGANSQ